MFLITPNPALSRAGFFSPKILLIHKFCINKAQKLQTTGIFIEHNAKGILSLFCIWIIRL